MTIFFQCLNRAAFCAVLLQAGSTAKENMTPCFISQVTNEDVGQGLVWLLFPNHGALLFANHGARVSSLGL